METNEVVTTETQLVKIVNESGLDKSKAQVLLEKFNNYFEIAADWESKAKMLIITSEEQVTEMKMAGDARKFLKSKRIEIENTRKVLKEDALREGQTIDSIARILKNLIEPIEQDLELKEKYREIKIAERKEAEKQRRIKLIEQFGEVIEPYAIGEMSEAGFNDYFTGVKTNYEARMAVEKKAEEERIAKEKAEAEERERQRLENIRLKAEAEERERLAEIERKKQAKILAEQKAAADKREAELKAKADEERKERERLTVELQTRKDAEEKARKEAEVKAIAERKARLTAEKKARLAPDKTKLLNFMQAINDLSRPEVKSIEAADIAAKANIMLTQAANYIKENANKFNNISKS